MSQRQKGRKSMTLSKDQQWTIFIGLVSVGIVVVFGLLYGLYPGREAAQCDILRTVTVEDCLPRDRDLVQKCAVVFFGPPALVVGSATGFINNNLLNYTSPVDDANGNVVYFEYTSAATALAVTTRSGGSSDKHTNDCCNYRTQAEADAVAAYLNDAAESDSKIPCWWDRGVYYLVPMPTYYDPWFVFFGIMAVAGVGSALLSCLSFFTSMGAK